MPAWLGRGDGIGSNSWVVDGEHSTTGAPILANDPHLGVSIPGVWMQVGLHCRTVSDACPFDVAGFSFSGVPGVIIGHNADIAWGFTNLGPDVTDLYVERIEGDDLALRPPAPADAHPRGDDQGGGRRRRRDHRALHRPRPGALRRRRPARRRGRGREAAPTPARRGRDGGVAGVDRPQAPPTADAIFELNRAQRLGRVPGRARRLRGARRRTSCTPTAKGTSATRRPA